MKLNDRLTKIEGLQRSAMLPAITLMRIIYEPSETGPKEVGAFARIRSKAGYTTLWRSENECQNNFEARIEFHGAVKQIGTSIRLLAQPKSMRSIIDATQREQRHGSA